MRKISGKNDYKARPEKEKVTFYFDFEFRGTFFYTIQSDTILNVI